MSRLKTKGHTRGGLPARRPTTRGIVRRSSVQAKAGDDGEGVTAPNIDRDPLAPAAITVTSQIVRTQRRANKASAGQCIGNSAGAVIAAVIEGAMAAAVSIRFRAQLIRGPDGTLHREGSVHGRQGQSATEQGLVSRCGGARRRKRSGKADLRREDKNRGDKNKRSKQDSHGIQSAVAVPHSVFRRSQESRIGFSQSIGLPGLGAVFL